MNNDDQAIMTVELKSFGFKHGEEQGNLVFDVRFLPNPYYIDSLKPLTGKDKACADYIFSFPVTHEILVLLKDLVLTQAEGFREYGGTKMKVCVGCTGGQHRSVAIVEALAREIEKAGLIVVVSHREIC